jgi:hypothetical protein
MKKIIALTFLSFLTASAGSAQTRTKTKECLDFYGLDKEYVCYYKNYAQVEKLLAEDQKRYFIENALNDDKYMDLGVDTNGLHSDLEEQKMYVSVDCEADLHNPRSKEYCAKAIRCKAIYISDGEPQLGFAPSECP